MYNKKRVCAIVTARMNSSRLPGKSLLMLKDKPVLQHIHERLSRVKYIDKVIIAMPDDGNQTELKTFCAKMGYNFYAGSPDDVLSRVLKCAYSFDAEIIVDVTGDCPLVCTELVSDMIVQHGRNKFEYTSNVIQRTFPRGFDIQVFDEELLEKIDEEVDNPVDRQHVTSWHYLNPKNCGTSQGMSVINNDGKNVVNYSRVRLTLDTQADYELLNLIFCSFKDNKFTYLDVQKLIEDYPEMFLINNHVEQKNYYNELANWYLYGDDDHEKV